MTTTTTTARTAPGRLPMLGHSISILRNRTDFTSSLYRHGDLVRVYLGPMPVYVVTDKDLVRRVMVTDAGNFERGMIFERVRAFTGDGLVTLSGTRHRRLRRLMQPAFHKSEIAGYVAGMARLTEDMVESWHPGECRTVDDDMQVLASRIVGQALFSTSLHPDELAVLLDDIAMIIGQTMIRGVSPQVLSRLPLPVNRRFDRRAAHLRDVVTRVVAERRSGEHDHHDLLQMLLTARYEDTGEGLTDQEIHDQVITVFVAGAETTARALAWLFHELARRKDVRDRVLAELDRVLGGAPVTAEHLPRLVYLRQVIDEVLRHYAVWLLMRRTVTEVDLGGVRLPAGTELIVSPNALHHDPRYFPDPDRFDPDRWSPERTGKMERAAFLPFAVGAHQCIGNSFAITELAVVAATLLSRVRLTHAPGKPMRPKVTNLPIPSGLRMVVTLA